MLEEDDMLEEEDLLVAEDLPLTDEGRPVEEVGFSEADGITVD
jgi:hypothetical protein